MFYFFDFLLNHWFLSLSFLIVFIFFIIFELSHLYSKNSISSFELVNLMNRKSILIVDYRIKDKYLSGHILNSYNISLEENELFFKKYFKKTIICVCDDGKTSSKKVLFLKKIGCIDVKYLDGGINFWIKDGYPLV